MPRRRSMKARLSQLANELYEAIHGLKPHTRGAARRTLNGLTGGEAWTLHALRPALHEFLDMASSGRARKARAKKEGR